MDFNTVLKNLAFLNSPLMNFLNKLSTKSADKDIRSKNRNHNKKPTGNII
jgi:hypothetical protein